jgi:hypothetical protein
MSSSAWVHYICMYVPFVNVYMYIYAKRACAYAYTHRYNDKAASCHETNSLQISQMLVGTVTALVQKCMYVCDTHTCLHAYSVSFAAFIPARVCSRQTCIDSNVHQKIKHETANNGAFFQVTNAYFWPWISLSVHAGVLVPNTASAPHFLRSQRSPPG